LARWPMTSAWIPPPGQPLSTQISSPSAPQVVPKIHGALPGNCCAALWWHRG
jgi:hypothetical protein